MERYDQGYDVTVIPPRQTGVILAVLVAITILIVLIIVLIVIRLRTASKDQPGQPISACINDLDCTGTQICDVAARKCVDCLTNANCPIESPLCNSSTNKCVSCVTSNDCNSATPKCDPVTNKCVACGSDGDCGGAAPFCDPGTKTCVGCKTNANCSAPRSICDPGTKFCVQCLSNAQCTGSAVCVSGICCDLTTPTMLTLGVDYGGSRPRFTGTYAMTQDPTGLIAIFDILDSNGVDIYTTAGEPATGIISIPEITNFPLFYSFFSYDVRVRLVSECGSTDFSPTMSAIVPSPISFLYPTPLFVDTPNNNFIRYVLLFPDSNFIFIYSAVIYISLDPNQDPNQMFQTQNIFPAQFGQFLLFETPFPFPVGPGETIYTRLGGANDIINRHVMTNEYSFTM